MRFFNSEMVESYSESGARASSPSSLDTMYDLASQESSQSSKSSLQAIYGTPSEFALQAEDRESSNSSLPAMYGTPSELALQAEDRESSSSSLPAMYGIPLDLAHQISSEEQLPNFSSSRALIELIEVEGAEAEIGELASDTSEPEAKSVSHTDALNFFGVQELVLPQFVRESSISSSIGSVSPFVSNHRATRQSFWHQGSTHFMGRMSSEGGLVQTHEKELPAPGEVSMAK